MRILYLHPFLSSKGGAQLALLWLLKGLARKGHSIKLLTADDREGLSGALRQDNILVKVLPIGSSPLPEGLKEHAGLLQAEIKDMDVVVAGNFPATLWGAIAKEKLPKFPPFLWYCNEPPRILYEEEMSPHFLKSRVDPKFYFPWTMALKKKKWSWLKTLDQQAVSQMDGIFAISRQTAEWIKSIYHRDAPIIPLGIGDIEQAEPHFQEGLFLFFSPAGLEPIKNFQTVLAGFKILLSKLPGKVHVKIVLTGAGYWKPFAEKMAKKLKIEDCVEFAGHVSRQHLINYYRSCHAVVFIPLDEPYGLVSCEAGLCGKSVIASNHGGPSEIVVDRETGFLVNPLNPDNVADAMLKLIQDRSLCGKMGQAAQDRIVREFSFEACLEKFEQSLGTFH